MTVEIRTYDKSKYERDSKRVAIVEQEIEAFEVKTISDEEIYSNGFDDVDPYQEYLVFTFQDGSTSTFRNSFVDIFLIH